MRRRTAIGMIATSAVAFAGLSVAVPAANAAAGDGWQCISPMQRYVNPASDARPNVDLTDKSEVKLGISYHGGDLVAEAGKKLTLAGARLDAALPGGEFAKNLWVKGFKAPAEDAAPGSPYVAEHYLIGHDRQNQFPIHGAVAIEATNTVEGSQRVFVRGTWSVNVDDPTFITTGPKGGTSADPSAATVTIDPISLEIPPLTWTPNGNGPVEFRVAPHGSIGDQVTIYGRGYPGRADHNIPINVRPYGSIFLRPETDGYGLAADCVFGDIAVVNDNIKYSRLFGDVLPDQGQTNPSLLPGTPFADGSDTGVGELRNPGWVHDRNDDAYKPAYGSRGRYAISSAARPAFATAALAPAPTPVPTTPAKTPASVSSTRLKASKRGTVSLRLRNASKDADVGSIGVRTKSAVKVGKAKKGSKFAVTAAADYRLAAGKSRTFTLVLSTKIKQALKTRKSVTVTVTLKSDNAKAATTKSLRITR